MSRRRLRVVCFSDEEDEDLAPPPPPPPPPPPQQQQQQDDDVDDLIIDDIETDFQTVTLNSANPTPHSNISSTATTTIRPGNRQVEPIPLDISDDDLENINVDHAGNDFVPSDANGSNSLIEVSDSPVHGVLEKLGLRVRREWLDSCLHGLQSSVQGFQGMDDSAKAKLCFCQFLLSDLNYCGAGVLPPNVQNVHCVDLKGPFVLQVDEIVNISKSLRERYNNKDKPAPPGIKRCLKLSMTDGVQRVFGMEYRPIKDLNVFAPAGLKVVICNVTIRHGLMMLVPENIEVLGGSVEELEAARQRLVTELNKPPRGKRTRTGVVPPLVDRATLAAWPQYNDAASGHPPVNTVPPQANVQVNIPTNMHRRDFATPSHRSNAETNTSSAPRPREQAGIQRHANMTGTSLRQGLNNPREEFEVSARQIRTEPINLSPVQPPEFITTPQHIDEPTIEVMAPPGETRHVTPPDITADYLPEENVNVPVSRNNDEHSINTSSIPMDIEEISVLDDLEHHFILSIGKESPFTYLASLSTKLAANDDETSVVRGKIKCFLTGVKRFNYKERNTFELQAYVDDGSLISEILINHNVVQKAIGYSPQEVMSALESSDTSRASEMKQTLKQFQMFLVDFEGTMMVEMSRGSSVPVAVEMEQGCLASDALLLLKRVKSFTPTQSHLDPIDLSP